VKKRAPAARRPVRRIAGKDLQRYRLQLFITGMSPRSTEAVVSVKAILEDLLEGQYDLEIVDLYEQPERARESDVIASPTLIKQEPLPARRLVGSMAHRARVVMVLDLLDKQ
jgi:circadian clock protein KaiB